MLLVVALMVLGQPEGAEKAAGGGASIGGSAAVTAVPWPHPMISEVLYAVPTGSAGDANKDGKREVCGDEFIELVNPHDKPIQLFGYTLTDSQDAGKGQVKFTFPAVELPPGGVAVVFNGMGSAWSGPVGDAKAPPTGKNELFGGAWVFTMKNSSGRVALGNTGDHVLLSAPDRTAVHRVYWSEAGPEAEEGPGVEGSPGVPEALTKPGRARPLVVDFVPLVSRGSVQRESVLAGGRFVSHMEAEGAAYSPGVYVVVRGPEKKAAEAQEEKPAERGDKPGGAGAP
ncbi:MAG: lamin tail domain-containing protein [Phycisphaerales bacterium]